MGVSKDSSPLQLGTQLRNFSLSHDLFSDNDQMAQVFKELKTSNGVVPSPVAVAIVGLMIWKKDWKLNDTFFYGHQWAEENCFTCVMRFHVPQRSIESMLPSMIVVMRVYL